VPNSFSPHPFLRDLVSGLEVFNDFGGDDVDRGRFAPSSLEVKCQMRCSACPPWWANAFGA
jgi:hypothetical protein